MGRPFGWSGKMTLFLDTETTGLRPSRGDRIVEVAIVDDRGKVLLNSLVDPERPIPSEASDIHGISTAMVRGKPTLRAVMPLVREIVSGHSLVIYNAAFDVRFFPGRLAEARNIECAMLRFTDATGGGRWRKLSFAASHVGHVWGGAAHRALADAEACRSVWRWLEGGCAEASEMPRDEQDPKATPSTALALVMCPYCGQRHRAPAFRLLDVTCHSCRRVFRCQT
jgi:DNA polymerase III epsilon subunit-like protein